jgi:Cu(I)/Ag(I) efflux system membrane fusion protein
MKRNVIIGFIMLVLIGAVIVFIYPKPFSKPERKILYWTDAMIPGDRSDHPGKSPMGMDRTPVYAGESRPESSGEAQADSSYYTCPMHPSVHKDKPGACPVCGMALVKKSAQQEKADVDVANINGVSLSPTQRVMANVTTATVERKALKKEVTAVGVVDFAEPNYLRISMRFPGRLDKLYLTYTGQDVRKGDPVADVYSPEAISAQQEYLLALESSKELKNAPENVAVAAKDLYNQARQKLLRWGFTEQQVNKLDETSEIARIVTMLSPINGTVMKKNVDPQHYAAMGEDIYEVADLSTVWIYLDMYEKDIRFVRVGQTVRTTTEAYPNETFVGRVAFIDPVLNADTRTMRVRTEFANSGGKLKPNMYVKASIAVPSMNTLVIPASSIMSTGKRSIVWVEVQPNAFEPRDVMIGTSTETYAEVVSGLNEGERVAETGGFLIDSESSLQQPRETDVHVGHGDNKATTEEPYARPSEYFKPTEKHADNNEAGILVKGKYSPEIIHVKAGVPVTLHFYRDEDADCTNEVVFESLGIRRRLPARETTTIVFTPRDTGEIAFSCGMGMVRGKLIVSK